MKRTFIKQILLTLCATLFCVAYSFGQTAITTGAISPSPACAGSDISVPFTTTGTVLPAVVFVAQLSDEAGAFSATPAEIGTSATSPITASIPASAVGAGYKVRVVSKLAAVVQITGSESVALTINAIPAAPTVTSPVNYAQNAAASALTATPGANLLWYTSANGGTGSATAPTPTTDAAGTTSYWVSQKPAGCESERSKIDVIVAACTPPAAPTVAPVSYTVGDKAVALTATGAVGATFTWYASQASTTPLISNPIPATTTPGTTSYFVTQTVGGCESAKAEIVVTVAACTPPAAPTVANKSYTVGDNATVLTATGVANATFKWYDSQASNTPLASAPTPSTAAAGTKSYFVTQTVGGCESAKAELVVTVSACTPPAAPSVAPVSYTVGDKAIALTVTGAAGATFTWYASQASTTPLISNPIPETTTPGTTSYFVTQTVGGCESAKAELVVTVSACTPPAAPTVANKSYTVGDNATVLTATGVANATFKWYDSQASTTPLASAPTPSTATAGTKSYFVTQTLGGCESAKAELVVTVSACTPPAAPTVTNRSYTVGDNATVLTATGVNGATFKWYDSQASTTPLNPVPTPSTATAGTKSYFVTQTVGGCESAKAELVVTVSACTPPAAPNVTNKTYTVGDNATPLTATGVNGAIFKWYASQASTTPLNPVPTPSTATAGTKSYFVTQTVGGCESAKAELVVTVSACTPPAAPTVTARSYTVGDNATPLTASGVNGATFKWYDSQASTTPLASAPTPSTKTAGKKSYFVTQTVGGCESAKAELVVIVDACKPPAKPTVAVIGAVCLNTVVPASVLANAVSPKTNLLWYTSADGGTGTTTPPTPDTKTAGTKTYYVSQVSSPCESERVAVSIEVKELPAAPKVTAAVAYCKDATNAATLTAEGTGLKWYNAGGGTISAPKPATTTVGETSFFVTQTVAACESPKAEIRVKINALPANAVAEAEALCQEKEDKSYPFSATGAAGSTFNWYAAQTGGAKLDATPAVNLKNAGETTSYVTQVDANGCESPVRVAKKIRVKKLPAKPGVVEAPIEYCQFIVAKALTATPETGGVLNWYGTNQTGGSAGPAPIPSTAEGGTTTYYVSQSLEQCEGDRAKIDVKVNTTPKPTTKTYLEYCQNETAQALDATGTVLKWYRGANDTEFQGIPFIPFTEKVQDYSFFVTQTGSNGCESPKEEIKIHIKSLPSATISGNATIDLGQSANINIRFTGDGPWKYVLSNGDTATTTQSNHQVSVKPTTTTSYLITEVSNACGKGIPIGSAMVTVKVPTINSGSPSVSEICAGKQFTVPFQQSGDFPAGNSFKLQVATENADAKFFTIPSTSSNNAVTATFPDTTKGGTYFLRVISSGTNAEFLVKGSVSSITINASPLPVATLSGTQTILVGGIAELKTEITGRAPWIFTLNNGTKDTLITVSATPYILRLAPKTTTTYAITKVTNGCGTGNGVGTARVQVDPILGVEPATPANWAKVYPTVVNGKCTVEVTGSISPKQATIEIVDLSGRARSTQVIKEKKTDVDFGTYPSGLYLIRVRNGNLNTVQRVMKP